MAAITIGAGAANLDAYSGSGYTYLDTGYPATGTGTLTSFETWYTVANGAGVKMGTFYLISGTTYKMRDYESIGAVTKGSKQTFTGLNCDVETGDILGDYHTGGGLEHNMSGGAGGRRYLGGDKFNANENNFSNYNSGYKMGFYGTGTTPGWSHITKVNGVASANIAKVNGIAVANIAKINGIAV